MSKIRFGIIGCGRISAKHVEALMSNQDEAELVALYDIDKETALNRKVQYEANINASDTRVYTDYKQFLEEGNIDVVTIASISGFHAQQAIDCLNHGKHVLIEKPMALTLEDVDKIIATGRARGKKICVSHQNRFIPSVQALKKAVDDGRFGKLINGTARTLWTRDNNYYEQADWRGTKKFDGGTLLNQCIHNIDLLLWIMGGEVERLCSETDTFIRNIETEDFGAMLIRFKNGAVGVVEGSVCVYPKNLEESLSIFGEKGTVVLKGNMIDTWIFEDERNCGIINNDAENHGHVPLYRDFISAIKNDREPIVNGEEGRKAVELILRAYEGRK